MKSFIQFNESKVYVAKLSGSKAWKAGNSGRGVSTRNALVNDLGEYAFLDRDQPYMPDGGGKVLKQLYKDSPEIFEFKKYDFGKDITIKRGQEVK